MKQQEKVKPKRAKIILIICLFLAVTAIASEIIWSIHIRKLRTEMETHLKNTISLIEQRAFNDALTDAQEAMILAVRLRDEDAVDKVDAYALLAETVISANDFFDIKSYGSALETYNLALVYLLEINVRYPNEMQLGTSYINEKITITEMYIAFFSLIEQADRLADTSEYEAAIIKYNEAKLISAALSFTEGTNIADSGIKEMQERIIIAKRQEATAFYEEGDFMLNEGLYEEALILFNNALEIYTDIEDLHNITMVNAKIDHTKDLIEKANIQAQPDDGGDREDPALQEDPPTQDEQSENYEHNIKLSFDLKTPIDDQSKSSANQIKMGTSEGMNEGWYNGCGWVAAYNALIILGNPQHPADIVKYFEESGGTVFDGVFGTYPNAIEDYLKSLGFTVNQTLFPGLRTNLDNTIKESKVSILAYAHTTAAHYTAVEYRDDINKFVVYNDSSARNRSVELGFQNETTTGAALDSISAFISNTQTILFSFSLISVS